MDEDLVFFWTVTAALLLVFIMLSVLAIGLFIVLMRLKRKNAFAQEREVEANIRDSSSAIG
jgi:type II secretory pathway pseudopilin PulG